MIIAAIKNHPAEGLGYLEEIFSKEGVEFYYVEAYSNPKIADFDALVILGGPMGVYEAEKYPFLKWEMELVRKMYRDKPVFGICLGAQLIAAALGARVYPYIREVGWRKVRRIADVPLPEEIEVFQWHGDTFDLPENARLIYEGEEVRNQCFIVDKAFAMQFHIEMTFELIEKWVSREKTLSEDEKRKIIEESREKIKAHNELCKKFVEFFFTL
ncbi:MAG: gamma-glutamyl-gamma-aminobutyrate hydrolase family protein [Archaeoglobus sp.]|uniref:type 1 glutamine amidotransferase n=1 Tax=Archaeoglobus sp. TaxID=1872626 RepID=UPI001E0BF655|nr:gamma-glutamyl-gamma-aminobutyrate hydrolase family protein [Archaeoglobus sp.]MBO8179474.1 gamma-glutamyl-gamma-aminobutyrate hydrolase family protein [Archaeoglobus sp.]